MLLYTDCLLFTVVVGGGSRPLTSVSKSSKAHPGAEVVFNPLILKVSFIWASSVLQTNLQPLASCLSCLFIRLKKRENMSLVHLKKWLRVQRVWPAVFHYMVLAVIMFFSKILLYFWTFCFSLFHKKILQQQQKTFIWNCTVKTKRKKKIRFHSFYFKTSHFHFLFMYFLVFLIVTFKNYS